jgi:hypothetical protein
VRWRSRSPVTLSNIPNSSGPTHSPSSRKATSSCSSIDDRSPRACDGLPERPVPMKQKPSGRGSGGRTSRLSPKIPSSVISRFDPAKDETCAISLHSQSAVEDVQLHAGPEICVPAGRDVPVHGLIAPEIRKRHNRSASLIQQYRGSVQVVAWQQSQRLWRLLISRANAAKSECSGVTKGRPCSAISR